FQAFLDKHAAEYLQARYPDLKGVKARVADANNPADKKAGYSFAVYEAIQDLHGEVNKANAPKDGSYPLDGLFFFDAWFDKDRVLQLRGVLGRDAHKDEAKKIVKRLPKALLRSGEAKDEDFGLGGMTVIDWGGWQRGLAEASGGQWRALRQA